MTDEYWRHKSYYDPRVLIATQDVLASPFPDALLCLTGAQLNILRNLMQYAHRHATFVSEYHDAYYLSPTNEQWDDLQAIVDDLEGKLMGCEEFMQVLEDIKAATQCACDQLTAMPDEAWPSGGVLDGQRDYDDYESPVVYEEGDPPEGFATWDDWTQYKCKAAQRIVDDLTDLGERMEVWYTTGAAITFAAFQSFVLASAAAPPVAAVLGIVGILAIAGTALAMIAFQQWLVANKKDLVCVVHLSDTVQGARSGILSYIDENWDLVLGKPFGAYLFSYDVLSKAYDGGLDVSGYSAAYCESCQYLEGDGWFAVPLDPDTYTCFLSWGATNGLTVPKIVGKVVLGVMWDCYDNDSGVDVLSGRQWGSAAQNLWTDAHDTNGLEGDWQLSIYPTAEVDEEAVRDALHPGAYLVTTQTDYVAAIEEQVAFGWKWNGGSPWTVTTRAHYLVYQGEPPA